LGKLSSLLSQQPGIKLMGRANTGWQGLKLAAQPDCHLVVIGCTLPDMSGIAMTLSLKKRLRPPLVVIMFRHVTAEQVELAEKAGVDGYLLQNDLAKLPSLLRRVDPGSAIITDRRVRRALFGRQHKSLPKDGELSTMPVTGRRLSKTGPKSPEGSS
jgi:DNA-binding NarL/FixJ family response regulator